jgi:glucose-6-phosphate-specific signal transduction histidine kinase
MPDQLMAHRYGWVRVSSIIAMIAVSTYLAAVRDWDWYFWAPVGIAVYLASRVLWGLLLGILDQRRFKRELPH